MKDLRKVNRESRKTPGMREFFILILVYSYYNRSNSIKNEFSIPQTVLAEYYGCTTRTIKRWFGKLRELQFIEYAQRDNAGKQIYYKKDGEKIPYTIPKYKKIKCGDIDEIKFLNVYHLNQTALNQYLKDRIDVDVLGNLEQYKPEFDRFIAFLSERNNQKDIIEQLQEIDESQLTKEHKKILAKNAHIQKKISENQEYLYKKWWLDKEFPEFQCKYLNENSLRLTHEICNTLNPEHTEKINEDNYWRSSHARTDMLQQMLHTTDIVEYDVNGSIYRLSYNLYHNDIISSKIDIYELIWNKCNFGIDWTNKNRDKYRAKFKLILMPIYMRSRAIGYRSTRWEYIDKYYSKYPKKYAKLSREDKDLYETYKVFVEDLNMPVKKFQNIVKAAMADVLNTPKFVGPDIFIIESNLHILIREALLLKGIRCVNIYDGFYFEKGIITQDEFYQVYEDALKKLKDNLNNNIGTPLP